MEAEHREKLDGLEGQKWRWSRLAVKLTLCERAAEELQWLTCPEGSIVGVLKLGVLFGKLPLTLRTLCDS